MSAEDKSSSIPRVPLFSSDIGPMSPDGKMSTTSPLLPTPHAQPAGWTPDGSQDPSHRPHQNGQHKSWGVKQVIDTLLPTPTAGDASQSGHRQEQRSPASHSGTTLSDWARTDQTSSSEDSRASRSVQQDDERPKMTNAGSGPSSSVSRASLDPDGSWLKTSPDSSVQASLMGPLLERFYGTWPRSGSMHDGTVYEHPMSELRISENGSSSLLGTPTASTGGDHPENGHELLAPQMRRLLHSPTASDSDGKPRYDHRASPGYVRAKPVPNLAAQVIDELLPTPSGLGGGQTSRGGDRIDELLLGGVVKDLLPTPKTPTGGPESRDARTARGSRRGADLEGVVRDEVLLPTPEAWLGRREANATADPMREKSRRHEGERGRRSTTLPEALASIGEPMDPPSNDGDG